MAKKPSSGSKRSKRPVDKSAAKGGGIMSMNKSNTSPFMKIVIIVIIISMVTLFLAGGITGIIELFKPRPQAAKVDPVVALQDAVRPADSELHAGPGKRPHELHAAREPGQRAPELRTGPSEPVQQSEHHSDGGDLSSSSCSLGTPTQKAVKANKNAESPVLVDFAITTYYSGDATEAVKIAEGVIKKDPTFAAAFYNLAIFYEAVNRPDLAIAAYQKYIALDPTGRTATWTTPNSSSRRWAARCLPRARPHRSIHSR